MEGGGVALAAALTPLSPFGDAPAAAGPRRVKPRDRGFAWVKRRFLEGLERKNPVVYAGGGREYKMFQSFSDQVGLPALKAHLWRLAGIGATVTDRIAFDEAFRRAFPEARPRGRQGTLDLPGVVRPRGGADAFGGTAAPGSRADSGILKGLPHGA